MKKAQEELEERGHHDPVVVHIYNMMVAQGELLVAIAEHLKEG